MIGRGNGARRSHGIRRRRIMGKVSSGTSLAGRLSLLAASILVALAASELLVRLFLPSIRGSHRYPSDIPRDDFLAEGRLGKHHPLLGWSLQPDGKTINRGLEFEHAIQTNSRGLRDDEVPYRRRPDTRRILLLGDSFGMGDGVERGHSFADLLEGFLPGTEVVNMSVSGYGTDQELLAYREEGVKYGADVVLLAFVAANDFENNAVPISYGLRKPYFTLSDGGLQLQGVPGPEGAGREKVAGEEGRDSSPFPLHDFFDANSALYALAFEHLSRIPPLGRRWEAAGLIHSQQDVFYRGQIGILRSRPARPLEAVWRLTLELLEEWQGAALAAGSRPVLLLIPSHLQVYPDIWRRAASRYSLPEEEFDPDYPNDRLRSFCESRGLPVIDLLPDFRAAACSGAELYYKRNPHWNREGHLLAARVISRELRRRGLLDG